MSAGGLSYSVLQNYPKVTLPSVEMWGTNMNILKDPHRSITTRKIDKVGNTQGILLSQEESGDRIAEMIKIYPRGVNPMVSVSYDNQGTNGGSRGSITDRRSAVKLPYRPEVFRPPIVRQEQLMPLSRQPREWFYALTNPMKTEVMQETQCCPETASSIVDRSAFHQKEILPNTHLSYMDPPNQFGAEGSSGCDSLSLSTTIRPEHLRLRGKRIDQTINTSLPPQSFRACPSSLSSSSPPSKGIQENKLLYSALSSLSTLDHPNSRFLPWEEQGTVPGSSVRPSILHTDAITNSSSIFSSETSSSSSDGFRKPSSNTVHSTILHSNPEGDVVNLHLLPFHDHQELGRGDGRRPSRGTREEPLILDHVSTAVSSSSGTDPFSCTESTANVRDSILHVPCAPRVGGGSLSDRGGGSSQRTSPECGASLPVKPHTSPIESFSNPSRGSWTMIDSRAFEFANPPLSIKEELLHPHRDQSPLLSPQDQITSSHSLTESFWRSNAPVLQKNEILTNHSYLPRMSATTSANTDLPRSSIKPETRTLTSSSLLHLNQRGREQEADRVKSVPLARRTALILDTSTVPVRSRSKEIQYADPYSVQSREIRHETHRGTTCKGSFQSIGSYVPQLLPPSSSRNAYTSPPPTSSATERSDFQEVKRRAVHALQERYPQQ